MNHCRRLALVAALCVLPGVAAQPGPDKKKKGQSPAQYIQSRPALGTPAPDFKLLDLDGREFRLADIRGQRPIVIEFGSYT